MGLFNEVISKASGVMADSKGEQSGLLEGVMQMLDKQGAGGLGGLVQSFQEKGLGAIISSWIGTGENQTISAAQLQHVLGSDAIQKIAAKVGIAPDEMAGKLAEFLPGVIDKLTPDGKIPEVGQTEEGIKILKGK